MFEHHVTSYLILRNTKIKSLRNGLTFSFFIVAIFFLFVTRQLIFAQTQYSYAISTMLVLSCLTISMMVFVLSIANGFNGSISSMLDTGHGKHERVIDRSTTNTSKTTQSSKDATVFSVEAHLIFSNRGEFTILTPKEQSFLNSTMILAFEQSQIMLSTEDDVGRNSQMIDAQIVSKKTINNKEKNNGKEKRRNIRYSPQQNRYYTIYDYSILFEFGCGNLCGDKSGFWDRRRFMEVASSYPVDRIVAVFGRKVCKELRASTYKAFKTITDCHIRYV